MDEAIKQQIIFVLDDDNEVMTAALDPDSYLDEDNKQMNRDLIKEHEKILSKVERGEPLTQMDLILIRDANEMDLNDKVEIRGHHQQALALNDWLDLMTELTKEEAMEILERRLDQDPRTSTKVYRALHTLWEEATPNDVPAGSGFDDEGRCLKCGSRVSFADVTDTVVFVGDEIVKRHDGDITNKNCVKCTYPKQYPDYKDHDECGENEPG